MKVVEIKEHKQSEYSNAVAFVMGEMSLYIYGKGDGSPLFMEPFIVSLKETDPAKLKIAIHAFLQVQTKSNLTDVYCIETDHVACDVACCIVIGIALTDVRKCQPKDHTTWDYTFFLGHRRMLMVTHVTQDQTMWELYRTCDSLCHQSFVDFQAMEKLCKEDELNLPRQALVWDEEKYTLTE